MDFVDNFWVNSELGDFYRVLLRISMILLAVTTCTVLFSYILIHVTILATKFETSFDDVKMSDIVLHNTTTANIVEKEEERDLDRVEILEGEAVEGAVTETDTPQEQ